MKDLRLAGKVVGGGAPPAITTRLCLILHLCQSRKKWDWRACLLIASAGVRAGGATVIVVGMSCVFVPQDLQVMNITVVSAISVRRSFADSRRGEGDHLQR
jgi:hypothetical protein